ncbi:hypothetical protein GGU45_003349 [Niabella hirudinis]
MKEKIPRQEFPVFDVRHFGFIYFKQLKSEVCGGTAATAHAEGATNITVTGLVVMAHGHFHPGPGTGAPAVPITAWYYRYHQEIYNKYERKKLHCPQR